MSNRSLTPVAAVLSAVLLGGATLSLEGAPSDAGTLGLATDRVAVERQLAPEPTNLLEQDLSVRMPTFGPGWRTIRSPLEDSNDRHNRYVKWS